MINAEGCLDVSPFLSICLSLTLSNLMYRSDLNVGAHDRATEDIVCFQNLQSLHLRHGGGVKDTVDSQYFMKQTLRSILSLSRSLLWLRECLEEFSPTNLAFWQHKPEDFAKFRKFHLPLCQISPPCQISLVRQHHHLIDQTMLKLDLSLTLFWLPCSPHLRISQHPPSH